MTLRHPLDDLQGRTPVWVAMAALYLDTDLTDITLSYVARVCAASPYSKRELEHIMFSEVWPAFLPNLLSVAGEWAGWSEEFVQRRVLASYKRRLYLSWRLNPLKLFFSREWLAVARLIEKVRSESN